MIKIYEPMLKHSVCIHIWEQGKKEYKKATGDDIWENWDWATYPEPVNFCYHIWVDNKANLPTLVHELYHLASTIRDSINIDEEATAYYIWYVFRMYFESYQKI